MDGKSAFNMVTTGIMEIAANSCLKMYSSVIRGVSDGVAYKDSKVGGKDYYLKSTLLS
jgi:hypothetical protein